MRRQNHPKSRASLVLAVVEAMESRIFLDGTPQTITITVPEGQGVTFVGGPNEHIDIDFTHCGGTVTVTGTNLQQLTVKGGGVVVTGNLTVIDEVDVTESSDPAQADVIVDGDENEDNLIDLQNFVDDYRFNDIKISDVDVDGDFEVGPGNLVDIDDAHDARMDALGFLKDFFFGDIQDSSLFADDGIGIFAGDMYNGSAPELSGIMVSSIKSLYLHGDSSYTDFDISGGVGSFKAANLNLVQIDFNALNKTNFIGGNVTGSTFNIGGGAGTSLGLSLLNVTDSFINDTGYFKTLKLGSMIDSTAGSGGITGNTIGSFQVGADYNADFKLTPTLDYKYSLGSFKIGGTGYGDWDIGGTTHFLSAHAFDSSYSGTFGRIDTFDVGGTFSGALTSGSIGNASMTDLTNGNLWLTNPYSANSWNMGMLKVSSEISGSEIMSNGSLGSIMTMFTYNSWISAGISSTYTFGQIPTASSFASPCVIKYYYSDCPNMSSYHFSDSYVGAYDLQNVQIGNVQTQNYGMAEGFAAAAIDKLKAGVKSGTINLANIKSAADVTSALNAAGITPSDLGDLQFLLPAQ